MPKEGTIFTFKTVNFRLQLVELNYEDIGSDGLPTDIVIRKYQIRKNRKVLLTTCDYEEAVARFRALVYQCVNTSNLF